MNINKLFGITQGPWIDQDGGPLNGSRRIFSETYYIGSIGNSDGGSEETHSNARLISQAPAMLEALINTALMFDSTMICPPYRETINGGKVIGAIESATGLPWPEIKRRIGGEM